jgi:hypothetical protein
METIMKSSDLEEGPSPDAELDFAIMCFSPLSARPRQVPDHFAQDGSREAAPTNGDEELVDTDANPDPVNRNSVRRT